MISYSLEYPTAWAPAMRSAIEGWPPSFDRWRDDGGDTSPHIRGWFGSSAVPGGLPVPASTRATTSMVVGREPMTAPRLTSWLRQVALPVALDGDLDAIRMWDIGEVTRQFQLPNGAAASRIARASVRDVLDDAGGVARDDVLLAASELAANAVQHGGGPIELSVRTTSDSVAIELSDRNMSRHPEVRHPPVFSVSGRGMSIVDALAAHWGLTVRTSTKSVWCEFPL